MKIGFQGEKGAFSEVAVYKKFDDAKAEAYENFEDVFIALKKNEIDRAVIPFENTINGSIVRNYDLLLKYDLKITGEIFLKIRQCLISHKKNKLDNIRFAYSHPVALSQCRDFLRKNNIKGIAGFDTAGSVKYIKEKDDISDGAIASEQCASIYDMEVLVKDIHTLENNITKFYILSKSDNSKKREKTAIAFRTKHYPGALVNCLQRLAKNDINLTKLESRPLPENAWEYIFYAEFEGGTDDRNIKLALSEMEASSEFIKVLGSYPKGQLNK